MHALLTVDALDAYREDPLAQSLAWHDATMQEVEPWHAATLDGDRRLVAALTAAANGEPPPTPEGEGALFAKANIAMRHDPQVLRWLIEYPSCYTLPSEIFARRGVVERIEKVAAAHPAPPADPELSREDLEHLLAH